MANQLNDYEFGQMVSSVKNLDKKVDRIEVVLEKLDAQIEELNNKYVGGRGMLIGLLSASGALGAGALKIIEKIIT